MSRPLVAIVGRPNVGKSMLFNKLVGQRLSIVEDTPGVTRDRLYASCEWRGRSFDLVDTGGIEPSTDSEILLFMREQAQIAIDAATVIVLVTDIRTGVSVRASRSFLRSTRRIPPVQPIRHCTNSIRSDSETPSRSPRYTAMEPEICWMPAWSTFPRKKTRRRRMT